MEQEHSAEFSKDIKRLITAATNNTRVYWMNAPENNKTFPYVVYEIRSVGGDKVIALDIWGKRGDEIIVSDLADTIEAALDNEVIYNQYHASIISTQNNKEWIADEDERIIRLSMSFDATYQA